MRPLLVALVLFGLVISVGHTAEAGTERSVLGDPDVQDILRDYPDARPTADGAIELQPGMDLLVPRAQAASVSCDYGYLCVYENINFGGYGVRVSGCSWYPLPDRLKNQVSSLINNQETGRMAYFYDADINPHLLFGEQRAYGYRMDMRLDRAPDGRSWDNRMEYIDPC
jgi:peptidase inhibitor family I36